jgi:hypothetical protein
MKVVTKSVMIENEEFVLIKDTDANYGEYYGTIPYTELDEEGKMKRELNGFEICIEHTIGKALERRKMDIIRNRKIKEYLSMGFDKMTAILKAFECA